MTPLPILLAIKIILIITIRRRRKKGNNKEIANKEIATVSRLLLNLKIFSFPYGFWKARQILFPSLMSSEVSTNALSPA